MKIPNNNKAMIIKLICDKEDKMGNNKLKAMVENTIKRRQPNLAANAPVTGIAISAPPPKHNSSMPRVASFAPVLSLT